MAKVSGKRRGEGCCGPSTDNVACCKVDAIVTVDERGQMVLPKEVRKKAGIRPGDKFALVSIQLGDEVCCISLVKVDELTDIVGDRLRPIMGMMFSKRRSMR